MACHARKIEANRGRCVELWERLYPGVKMPQTYLARWHGEIRASCGWLLDMGSGGGGSLDFRAGPGPGASVGLDVDFESLKRNGNVLYHVVGSVDAMPFRDGVFDAVTAQYVLEHVEKPAECFGEISRVAAPGAWFLFMTTNAASCAGILIRLVPKKIQAMVKRRFLKMEEREIYPVYMRCNGKGTLARLLSGAGFGPPEWVFVGGPFYFAFSYALFRVAVMLERLTDGRLKHLKFYVIGRSRKSGLPPGFGEL